jgi:microcystin-dependent protein
LSPRTIGQSFGEESHLLQATETPAHTHGVAAISNPTLANNSDAPGPTEFLAQTTFSGSKGATTNLYVADPEPSSAMSGAAVGTVGGKPHTNLMPLLAINFCISLTGVFPSRS